MSKIHRFITLYSLFLSCVFYASANVEKVIFSAQIPVSLPQDAAIDNLLLLRLHPDNLSIRTALDAAFPTDERPHGKDTWVLVEGLKPGQRNEVRICWVATQPTSFWLDTFELREVFETPDLIASLSSFSHARHDQLTQSQINELLTSRYTSTSVASEMSILFLRIQAAADYFSLNKTLMDNVPPVHVDLILDPYLLNVFPKSLLPTAGYIVAIAVFAWFLSGWIYHLLNGYIANSEVEHEASLSKKKK